MDGQPDGRPKNVMLMLRIVVGGGIKIICDMVHCHAEIPINLVK